MLVNAVISTFPAEKADAAARILVDLANKSRSESSCLAFDVSRSNDDRRVFDAGRSPNRGSRNARR
jgi:quinol monooxygenase YgiN